MAVSFKGVIRPENPKTRTCLALPLTAPWTRALVLLPQPIMIRYPLMPMVSALLVFVAALFRSRASLHLENLALRHQLAVYQQTVHHP